VPWLISAPGGVSKGAGSAHEAPDPYLASQREAGCDGFWRSARPGARGRRRKGEAGALRRDGLPRV